jgi:hypothetical protein
MGKNSKKSLEAKANEPLFKKEGKLVLGKQINSLLNKSFDYDFLPLRRIEGSNSIFSLGSYVNKDGKLEEIFKISFFGLFEEHIGTFTKKDGSKMRVLPKYLEQAMKYANLYENQYGKKVKIGLVND